MDLDATVHTPMIEGISPSNSLKTATDVNQGNCSGVIVNLDPTHKELVLYSNNSSAVDQAINLGGYYAADDGNNYTFNGENIVVQFNNYAVIGLVKTTTQITTSSLPNGTGGAAYSQTSQPWDGPLYLDRSSGHYLEGQYSALTVSFQVPRQQPVARLPSLFR